MKKYISLAIVIIAALSLAACDEKIKNLEETDTQIETNIESEQIYDDKEIGQIENKTEKDIVGAFQPETLTEENKEEVFEKLANKKVNTIKVTVNNGSNQEFKKVQGSGTGEAKVSDELWEVAFEEERIDESNNVEGILRGKYHLKRNEEDNLITAFNSYFYANKMDGKELIRGTIINTNTSQSEVLVKEIGEYLEEKVEKLDNIQLGDYIFESYRTGDYEEYYHYYFIADLGNGQNLIYDEFYKIEDVPERLEDVFRLTNIELEFEETKLNNQKRAGCPALSYYLHIISMQLLAFLLTELQQFQSNYLREYFQL